MKAGDELFEVCSKLYPQPIALGCGRICRARSLQERLDAVLKCAEVITRYLAVVSINSFAAREDASAAIPAAFTEFTGPLSFGHFLSVVQAAANASCDHPLRDALRNGFRVQKGQPSGDAALTKLLNLRNRLGHRLVGMTEAEARYVLDTDNPEQALKEALKALDPILGQCPLFLIEEQRYDKKKLQARRLLLMGEGQDPTPEAVDLAGFLDNNQQPYLAVKGGALCLHPLLIWDAVKDKANFAVYLIDTLSDDGVKCVTVSGDELEHGPDFSQAVRALLTGAIVPMEAVTLADGTSFMAEWQDRKKQLLGEATYPIPWDELDEETIRRFGKHLGADGSVDQLRATIIDRLFDGREQLSSEELLQVHLLLGRPATIKKLLKRELLDCRASGKDPEARWDERRESSANVIQSLNLAIEFFGRHVATSSAGLTVDGLSATSGTADYIAMREGLVNLFIHQDYSDPSMAAQVEITPDRTLFFNPGNSLVNKVALASGGKSQSRNPILSRALRLIGFAELAGSGLREVHRAWRQVRRRPPAIESDDGANTFTLTLDWRTLPDIADDFWKKRLGVSLSPQQSQALLLCSDPFGASVEEVASFLGVPPDAAAEVCQALVKEVLVHEKDGRFYIKDHLQPLAEEARIQ